MILMVDLPVCDRQAVLPADSSPVTTACKRLVAGTHVQLGQHWEVRALEVLCLCMRDLSVFTSTFFFHEAAARGVLF